MFLNIVVKNVLISLALQYIKLNIPKLFTKLLLCMDAAKGNITETSKTLGISRQNLNYKLKIMLSCRVNLNKAC